MTAIWLASRSTSSRYWVVSSSVVPPVEPEDEDFWAPFLAYRPGDRRG
jgi:hypothetical protein